MAGFSVKIKKDLTPGALQAFADRIAIASNRVVKVGYPEGAKEGDGTSIAMIAAAHNFGVPENGLPERPFMTQAITKNKDAFVALNRKNIPLVLEDKMTTDEALGRLGAFAVGQVQREIKGGNFVALKEETIERKGSSKPLMDTNQMLQSTTFVIDDKK